VKRVAGALLAAPSALVAAPTAALLAAPLAIAGCGGEDGTITIEVVTAPDSTVLDDVVTARMVLTNPLTVVEAERDGEGRFALSLDVVAEAQSGAVLLEGLDADDNVVAYGRTPLLPIAAIDASITIYLAPPRSLAAAAVELTPARTDLGASLLEYGVVLAGGRDADGAPTANLAIYNAYDHVLELAEDMPEPRAGVSVGTGITGYAYVFGGEDATGAARGTLWRLDTTVTPAGEWLIDEDDPTLARAGAGIAPLGNDAFLITGEPPVLLEGLLLRTTPFDSPSSLAGGAASIQREDEPGAPVYTLVIGEGAGSTGITRLALGTLDSEAAPADAIRTGHSVVSTAQDKILAVGGRDATGLLSSVIVTDPALRHYGSVADVLATPRVDAAIAATASYLVVAGGRDATGAIVPDAEIFDVETLARIGTIPMVVPRAGAIARPLPNQQILIAGGVDASGAPVPTIELFTPDPPEL